MTLVRISRRSIPSLKRNSTPGIPPWEVLVDNSRHAADCTDLDVEDAYCVKPPTTISTVTTSSTSSAVTSTGTTITPPGPTQAGIPANCDAYALTQPDDGCQAFADRNKITLENLYNWNPFLNNDCENFWAEEAYCIGVSS
ncbi:predicted protein [Aspergillus terreus NIH2624]|uniref:LysM domain-containing protein n=1 Tax=Aspergillus terreus (strain NIH 2624 / FGSC A1156) TaxID=341663 RepID=Q0CMI8_ASPTN|nr:uncharacterized protein ATEG_05096 [Aspergillus terreus NIH2624]EAU34165.1 predicted protein [Aspergillus terreus NIH2624]